VLASLIAAVVAPLFYGVASAMQAMAVRAASRPAGADAGGGAFAAVDPGLVVRMFRQWRFVVSLGLDMLGFVAQLVALNRLPLFAVQAMIAANLAVTAVCASWLIGASLGWREWAAVGGVIAGVGLLGGSAGAEGAARVGETFKLALIVAVAGIGLIGLAAARLPGPARTPLLGATAGLGYGVLAVAARVLNGFDPVHLIKDPAAYALAAAGIVSFLFYASALERGSVTVAVAAVVLVETIPPAAVGIVLLGDKTRHGLAGLAIAGFILAVICAVQLARFGQTEDQARKGHDAPPSHPQASLARPTPGPRCGP
jgi:drug/metabolite transporter (DMT)-like permease